MEKALLSPIAGTKCTGCRACVQACPMQCVKMEMDERGFHYPVIDHDVCISCNRCHKICPVLQDRQKQITYPDAFVGYAKQKEIVNNSSSGGIFSLLAETILEEGGTVFGAAMAADMHVNHIMVRKKSDLEKLRGSKYIQSNIMNTYQLAKNELEAKRKVLFSGTPCQISGLKSYLGKQYDNLLTVDVICHGVPSEKVWSRYLAEQMETLGSKISSVIFRKKTNGWKNYGIYLQADNTSKLLIPHKTDLFFKTYLNNICLRPSCYQCQYKGTEPVSEITLGDAWNIESFAHEMYNEDGVSLIFVNNLLGAEYFQKTKKRMVYASVPAQAAISGNPAYSKSARVHEHQRKFYKRLNKNAKMAELARIADISWDVRLRRIASTYWKRLIK